MTKPGVVGAFCRAYTVEEAIDAFLSDVYAPSAMNGRYDYIPADSSAGVVTYSDSAEYKMWGNGVALPCVWFVLCGIVWYAQSGGDNAPI